MRNGIASGVVAAACLVCGATAQAGNFYTNVVLKGAKQADVVEFLKKEGKDAFVSPATGGAVVVYEMECENQDAEVLSSLAKKLSKAFKCAAVAFLNHDDDILLMKVYSEGKCTDEYDSYPGYFDKVGTRKPVGGDAKRICRLLDVAGKEEDLEKILRKKAYNVEFERHDAILKVLSLPACSSGFGHKYLSQGETPDGFEKFQRTK
jgi:hypothetical protein